MSRYYIDGKASNPDEFKRAMSKDWFRMELVTKPPYPKDWKSPEISQGISAEKAREIRNQFNK